MDNFEKVETGLELCTHISPDCCLMLCPYKDEQDETYSAFCEEVLKHDALKLLKEQQEKIKCLRAIIKKKDRAIERKDEVIDASTPLLKALINENESLRNELLNQLKMHFDEEDAKEFAKEFMSDEVHEMAKQFRQRNVE